MALQIHDRPSPNHGARPRDVRPDLIVVHGTAGGSEEGDLSWLCSRDSQVSYHYLIGRDGRVYGLVPDDRRAWHAGSSGWQGRDDCNNYSIGVALSNRGPGRTPEPYTDAQYASLVELTRDLMQRWGIARDRIVGHADVSPGRKTDPWAHFDWSRFRAAL